MPPKSERSILIIGVGLTMIPAVLIALYSIKLPPDQFRDVAFLCFASLGGVLIARLLGMRKLRQYALTAAVTAGAPFGLMSFFWVLMYEPGPGEAVKWGQSIGTAGFAFFIGGLLFALLGAAVGWCIGILVRVSGR